MTKWQRFMEWRPSGWQRYTLMVAALAVLVVLVLSERPTTPSEWFRALPPGIVGGLGPYFLRERRTERERSEPK